MNFKKYHVSKNLFDPNSTRYHMGKGANNQIAPFGNGAMFYIEAESNMTYTIKVHTTDSTFVRLYLSNAPIVENVVKSYNVISESENIMNPEVTISNTDYAYLWIQIGGAWYTEHGGSSIMLNTGSTPLPYEPYSSEVWHDIPYYQHKTATDTLTLPAVIYPNGTTATVGLKGQTVQNGSPTLDNPVMPQGTGERTGNLFDELNFALVQVTSTAYRYGTSLGVLPQGTYTFNATKSAGAQSIYLTAKLNGVYSQTTISSVPFSFTADGDSEYIIRTANNTGTTWEAEKYSDMMLNTGSTTLPYEPYGYKILISSANTTTPVYLGEVETTRRIGKYVLTGEESIALNGKYDANEILQAYYTLPSVGTTIANNIRCTHLKTLGSPSLTSTSEGITMRANGTDMIFGIPFAAINVSVSDSMAVALTKLIAYLQQQYSAGTPVTVWYVLATETTGIVNEPIRKIDNYADTVSGITIPTITGKDTFDVQTTLKPSEVSLSYTGWHDAIVHEKSRNLFDKDNADLYEGTSLSVKDKWYYAGGQAIIIRIPCEATTLYTLKITASNTVFRISTVATDDVPSGGNDVVATTIANSDEITEYTFTTPSDAKYILFQGSYAVLSTILNTLMLNEGSTVIPYEPYWA